MNLLILCLYYNKLLRLKSVMHIGQVQTCIIHSSSLLFTKLTHVCNMCNVHKFVCTKNSLYRLTVNPKTSSHLLCIWTQSLSYICLLSFKNEALNIILKIFKVSFYSMLQLLHLELGGVSCSWCERTSIYSRVFSKSWFNWVSNPRGRFVSDLNCLKCVLRFFHCYYFYSCGHFFLYFDMIGEKKQDCQGWNDSAVRNNRSDLNPRQL